VSQENVEIVRRAHEAGNSKPKPDFATLNALFHPDHEFVARITAVEGQSFSGAQGFREFGARQDEAWESWEATIEGLTEIDDDRVLVVLVFKARSRIGGVPMEDRFAYVSTLRSGKIIRTETYSSPEQALETIELSE
jgi:ketosteroid isomerase-like protein